MKIFRWMLRCWSTGEFKWHIILCACVHTQIWNIQAGWSVQQEACRWKLHQRCEQGAGLHGCQGIFTLGHDLQAFRGEVILNHLADLIRTQECFACDDWDVLSFAARKDKRTNEALIKDSLWVLHTKAINWRNRKPYCFACCHVNNRMCKPFFFF